MELTDIARALTRYRWLILALVLVAMGLAAVMHSGESKTYVASTRLVLDTPDPESAAESAAIADTAKAIATSPGLVEEALTSAGVGGRDAGEVARNSISVRALGSSGIVQISVRDQNPAAAAMIANALAGEVIETRLEVTTGQSRDVLRDLDRRITNLNRRISALDARISAFAVAAEAAPDAASANVLRARGDEAERMRDFLAQQRSVGEAERVTLLSSAGLRPKPSIISRATRPESAEPSRLVPDMLLVGIIGLILAIGIVGMIEFVRPKVTGGPALARELDTPLLGTIRADPAEERAFEGEADIAARIAFAAEAAGINDVTLLPVVRAVDVEALAERLQVHFGDAGDVAAERTALARTGESGTVRDSWTANVAGSGQRSRRAPDNASGLAIRSLRGPSPDARGRDRTGLVVVSPTIVRKAELDEAAQFVRGMSLPLLGLIAVAPVAAPRLPVDESVPAKLERSRRSA